MGKYSRLDDNPVHDTPAKRVLAKLKMTPTTLSRALKEKGHKTLNASTVLRWGYEAPRGRGGLIPQVYHRDIMAIARDRAVDLRADDLLFV